MPVFEQAALKLINSSLFSYSFDISDNPARLRFAVRNLEDERAPLADETYGYYSKTHSDLGRNYYLELRVKL